MSEGEMILYNTDDATTSSMQVIGGSGWLTQLDMAQIRTAEWLDTNRHVAIIAVQADRGGYHA